ncbi:MAG: hypothetical protein WA765_11745 [Candidatus Acidiferrum sp.]
MTGTHRAELGETYFCKVKFSTQVLISVWKMVSRRQVSSLSSMGCSGLHNFSATHYFRAAIFGGGKTLSQNKTNKMRMMGKTEVKTSLK